MSHFITTHILSLQDYVHIQEEYVFSCTSQNCLLEEVFFERFIKWIPDFGRQEDLSYTSIVDFYYIRTLMQEWTAFHQKVLEVFLGRCNLIYIIHAWIGQWHSAILCDTDHFKSMENVFCELARWCHEINKQHLLIPSQCSLKIDFYHQNLVADLLSYSHSRRWTVAVKKCRYVPKLVISADLFFCEFSLSKNK